MPEESLTDIMLDLKADLIRLSKSGEPEAELNWAKAYPPEIRSKYLEKILSEDWDFISTQAKKDMDLKDNILKEIKSKQSNVLKVFLKSEIGKEQITSVWVPLNKRDDWMEGRVKITEELLKKGISPEKIENELLKLEALKPQSMFNNVKDSLKGYVCNLDLQVSRNLSCFIGNMLLYSIAQFNKLVISDKDLNNPTEDTLEGISAKLLDMEKNIWLALKDAKLSKAEESAQKLCKWALETLSREAVRYAAAISRVRKVEPDNFEFGKLGMKAAETIRELLLGIVLGKWVDWLTGWEESSAQTSELMKAASSMDFTQPKTIASIVDILTLSADSAKFDGEKVTVEGVLGTVTIKHRNGKVISSAPIFDANGKSIQLVIPYIKLDSGGMAERAYARVSGTWNAINKEINCPALQIGRRSLSLESKDSWLTWVENSLRDVIEIVPHYLTAEWSWEPGRNGAINSIRYGTWLSGRGGK